MADELMNALVWNGGESFSTVTTPLPAVGDGETLVRLTTATICGSDRHTVAGRRSAPCPSVLGHEGVGVVTATTKEHLTIGQRVIFSVTAPCMECARCAAGLTSKCYNLSKTGHEPINGPWPASGTYATHILIRRHQQIRPIPHHMPDAVASLTACAGATVMAALEQAGPLEGKNVLVTGAGMLGLIAVNAAAVQNAASITAVDPLTIRRDWALSAGATYALAPGDALDPESFDVAIELSGHPSSVELSLSSLTIGATLVLVGSVADSPSMVVDPEWMVRGWRTITGVHNYEPRHLDQAIAFLSCCDMNFEELLSPPHPMAEIPDLLTNESSKYLREVIDLTSNS